MTQEIEIKTADGVQVIRFLRPEKKNAFTGPMYAAMSAALATTSTSSCVAPRPPRGMARASRRPRSISSAGCPR
jgi:hypothetical protein